MCLKVAAPAYTNMATQNTIVQVNNPMQMAYAYECVRLPGLDFDPLFEPALSPKKMLQLGVFEGLYLNSCKDEYPADWFEHARLSDTPDPTLNCFGVKSRQPLSVWRQKGWIIDPDPRGWFEWYCRYYMGRRLPDVDIYQIKRWRSFRRHLGQIKANCLPHDIGCRPRQRQALLQWAYDPFI